MIKKIAVLTSGGDAPGMNNAIVAIVKRATSLGIETYAVYEGYKGLHQGYIKKITLSDIEKYVSKGGTFIYSARYEAFKDLETKKEACSQLKKHGIENLIVIGGDGSYVGASYLHKLGINVITMPGTIDNDIGSTEVTIGYDTALNTIVEAIDKLRDTMTSHRRAVIVQVMGHGNGDLAIYSSLAGMAEIVISNGFKQSGEDIARTVKKLFHEGKKSVIILVSEFIYSDIYKLAQEVTEKSGIVTKAVSLEHLQRGGVPTAFERINASLMGIKAVELLNRGKSNLAISVVEGKIKGVPLNEALKAKSKMKKGLIKKINQMGQIV